MKTRAKIITVEAVKAETGFYYPVVTVHRAMTELAGEFVLHEGFFMELEEKIMKLKGEYY